MRVFGQPLREGHNNMLIVEYLMQFSGSSRYISNPCSAHRFAQANGGLTNTTMVHALLLPSKH